MFRSRLTPSPRTPPRGPRSYYNRIGPNVLGYDYAPRHGRRSSLSPSSSFQVPIETYYIKQEEEDDDDEMYYIKQEEEVEHYRIKQEPRSPAADYDSFSRSSAYRPRSSTRSYSNPSYRSRYEEAHTSSRSDHHFFNDLPYRPRRSTPEDPELRHPWIHRDQQSESRRRSYRDRD